MSLLLITIISGFQCSRLISSDQNWLDRSKTRENGDPETGLIKVREVEKSESIEFEKFIIILKNGKTNECQSQRHQTKESTNIDLTETGKTYGDISKHEWVESLVEWHTKMNREDRRTGLYIKCKYFIIHLVYAF